MSVDLINHLLQQAEALSPGEQMTLAEQLMKRAKNTNGEAQLQDESPSFDPLARHEMQWLSEHKHEYAGQFVALDGDKLIAVGASGREVLAAAHKAGVKVPFVTRIDSPDDLPFGGW